MAIRLGITGGIGSGKSVVARLLKTMGIPVYQTDDEAKRLTNEDAEIRRQLVRLAGSEVYLPDGTLNRPYLAAYLFAEEAHATKVNAVIHPRVKSDFIQWAQAHEKEPIIAIESAILIEAGFADTVDRIIAVYAPTALRLRRAALRDHVSEEQIRRRILCQMDEEKKCRMAHFVIINDDHTPLLPQVERLLEHFRETFPLQEKQ